ncbi:NADPH:quinone reductase [Roseibium sp. HPY-6]|uniref:NADPH:quinone reductase n=1 Tax=Roseibium sp. HPY-6 TaxID=3229852 RepID=UPI00338DECCC
MRIMASGINPADTKRRGGWNASSMAHPLIIPHSDGSGVIDAVGEGVSSKRIGERVWLWNAQGGYGEAGRAFGTAAEFVALPSSQAVRLPDDTGFESGACLGVPALTAWLALQSAGSLSGKTVLIQGAAGAVGQICVQIAVAHGAKVIATVGSEEGAQAVAEFGDVNVVNRHRQDVPSEVARETAGAGADLIVEVDLAANLDIDIVCLALHGTIASYSCSSNPAPVLPYYAFADLGAQIRFIQGFRLTADQRTEAEATITRMLREGTLSPSIGAIHPLSEIAAAHARVEAGGLGQTVLTLPALTGVDHE